ncbi:hypothetical protein ABMA28_017346 [Loxostege sticticalis]|uniref:BED-type domain-containing protein n=1 Tax=Loxostege sticticalis TaxID=481309 RepID=A0ABD0S1R4_LOXSC
MSPLTKSNVWDYFEPNKEDQDKANCKICNKSYSRKGRTTSSLKNHLKSMHSENFLHLRTLVLINIKNLSRDHSTSNQSQDQQALRVDSSTMNSTEIQGNKINGPNHGPNSDTAHALPLTLSMLTDDSDRPLPCHTIVERYSERQNRKRIFFKVIQQNMKDWVR